MFSDLQSIISSIKNRVYCGTVVAHIATEYYLAADMARDREMDLGNVPTAEMLADCFTKPLLMPAFVKQFAAKGTITIELWNDLENGLCMLGNLLQEWCLYWNWKLHRECRQRANGLIGQVSFEEIHVV
jgi:hypothetical protein